MVKSIYRPAIAALATKVNDLAKLNGLAKAMCPVSFRFISAKALRKSGKTPKRPARLTRPAIKRKRPENCAESDTGQSKS